MSEFSSSTSNDPEVSAPRESHGRIFRRFLRFGFLAWGGPVAQIDMIRHELVAQERWVTPEYFRRLLAVYQVLPGPEAHELCVHFGILARGRWGGVLAGLGFMLPGLVLMLLLSWFYLRSGMTGGIFNAVFLGIQPAVIALIIRACHRLSRSCLTDRALVMIALLAAAAEFLASTFWLTLIFGGATYVVARQQRWISVGSLAALFVVAVVTFSPAIATRQFHWNKAASPTSSAAIHRSVPAPDASQLFGSGLRAGLLTFGGAYTAIPFLQRDAVEKGAWMSERDFLDGLALSGILPAPLIIFSTFVGFFGGGWLGALAMTAGVFLPAFLFPLILHRHLQEFIRNAVLRHFLEGVTAGVIGIIGVTALRLASVAISNASNIAIAVAALALLYLWPSKLAVPILMILAGCAGALLFSFN